MIDAGLGVWAGFTTRHGGVSGPPYSSLNIADHVGDDPIAVARNRELVAHSVGTSVTYLRPEHSIRVAEITAQTDRPPVADVLVSATPGLALATIWADCVPLLLHARVSGVVAVAHAGRKGVYAGVVDAAVEAVVARSGGRDQPATVEVAVGPAICGRCYEVSETMFAEVVGRHPAARSATPAGTTALNLPRAVIARLGDLGVERIVHLDRCTAEDPDFYSFRAEGTTGRCAGIVRCA